MCSIHMIVLMTFRLSSLDKQVTTTTDARDQAEAPVRNPLACNRFTLTLYYRLTILRRRLGSLKPVRKRTLKRYNPPPTTLLRSRLTLTCRRSEVSSVVAQQPNRLRR